MAVAKFVKTAAITRAVADAMYSSPVIVKSVSGTAIKEGINDKPLVQVYFQAKSTGAGGNDRMTMGGNATARASSVIRKTTVTVHVDVYTSQRSLIGEDMAEVEELADEVDLVCESQNEGPYFNIEGVKSYSWRSERVIFDYSGNKYTGIRFYITLVFF